MDKKIDDFDIGIFPKAIKPVIEELYWLSQSDVFQKDVTRFRQKWCVFEGEEVRGLKENLSVQEVKEMGKDFQKIFSRCRLHNTRDAAEFRPVLYRYLTTDELRNYYDRSPRGLPPVTIKLTPDRKAFTIKGALPIDVTKGEFKTLVDLLFEDVKEQQRRLGIKRLEGATGEGSFLLSVRIWHIYKRLVGKGHQSPEIEIYGDYLDDEDFQAFKTRGGTGATAVSHRIRESKERIKKAYIPS